MNFEKSYDVIVAGGGIAGVAAAVASARRGVKTALVEKTVYTGGLATTGLIYIYLPLCDGNGTQVTYGLTEELLLAGLKYGPGEIPADWKNERLADEGKRYRTIFNPASLILAMDEMLEDAGVDIWYDTLVCKTVVDDNRNVTGIEVENKSGRGLLNAECFVDATGDADIAHSAGCNCLTEKNSLAMWALEYNDKVNELGPGVKMHMGGGSDDPPTEGFNGIDGGRVSRFVTLARRKYRKGLVEHYEAGKYDRNSRFPLFLPAMAQYRKSRRIDGSFTLSDGMDWTSFEDSVGMVADWRKPGFVWEIPYRSLIPEGLNNLLAAGRCMSSEKDAWEVTRVIPSAALTGEVSGVAAAMSVEQGTNPVELEISSLQEELKHKYDFPLHFCDVGLSTPGNS